MRAVLVLNRVELPVIIVKITGGLGNQLFQYATARGVALRGEDDLVLDTRVYQRDPLRRYCLEHFYVQGTVCNGAKCAGRRLPPRRNKLLSFVFWKCTAGRGMRYYREREGPFDPAVLSLRTNFYLHGYWQSEGYFVDVAPALRQDLQFRTSPSAENVRWLEEIGSTMSISVHVRRGDYVVDAKTNRTHGTCSPDYYRQAAETVQARLTEPARFFVFSDDPEWTRRNVNLPGETRYVQHNDDLHDYEDLRLMAACRHHIVANSSFSWWGAWLAEQPGQIVVAPRSWFRDPNKNDRDLVPARWARV